MLVAVGPHAQRQLAEPLQQFLRALKDQVSVAVPPPSAPPIRDGEEIVAHAADPACRRPIAVDVDPRGTFKVSDAPPPRRSGGEPANAGLWLTSLLAKMRRDIQRGRRSPPVSRGLRYASIMHRTRER